MSPTSFIATFRDEADLRRAIGQAHARGWRVSDTYTPYELADRVHSTGSADAAGLAPAGLAAASAGAVAAIAFQAWSSTWSWPRIIGGREPPTWPAYVPLTFEIAILAGALGVAAAFVRAWRRAMRTGCVRAPIAADAFAMRIEVAAQPAAAILHSLDAVEIICSAGESAIPSRDRRSAGITAVVAAVATLTLVGVLAASRDPRHAPLRYAPDMTTSPAADSYDPALRQPHPVTGTVHREPQAPRYDATEAGAQRAARELAMPVQVAAAGAETVRRGAEIYAGYCRTCHGIDGHGDGPTIRRGFQLPPSVLTQKARDTPDGRMFHVLTYGQNLMPPHAAQLSADDRWTVIFYLRELQRHHPVDAPLFTPSSAADK